MLSKHTVRQPNKSRCLEFVSAWILIMRDLLDPDSEAKKASTKPVFEMKTEQK